VNLDDLLRSQDIDPESVIVFRHRPTEPELRKVLPWLAAEHPKLYNAYQQTQSGVKVENALKRLVGKGYVASFIGHEPGRALYVALYKIDASNPLTPKKFQALPVYQELAKFGGSLWFSEDIANAERPTVEWFELTDIGFCSTWKGKLVINWPPPERSWWRRAHNNDFSVHAIREESALDAQIPKWQEINLTWEDLKILPKPWKVLMSQWRGIYYIFDVSNCKGYVGSACGKDNLIGRWENYAATGDGGNKLLRGRDPANFRFSILERVNPDLDKSEVDRIETTWKQRLHTYAPQGLNEN
jgi:hypothetical protein